MPEALTNAGPGSGASPGAGIEAGPAHRRIHCPAVPEPPGASWSNLLRMGDELVISGMTAHPAAQQQGLDAEGQARECLRKIGLLAEAGGGSLDNVVKLVVYLTDIADKDAVHRARLALLAPPYPASTLVGVQALVFPGLRVEIDATIRLDVQRSRLASATAAG